MTSSLTLRPVVSTPSLAGLLLCLVTACSSATQDVPETDTDDTVRDDTDPPDEVDSDTDLTEDTDTPDDTDPDTDTPDDTDADVVVDADGNVYATVTLGNQVWMASNLATTKFSDGTPITAYQFGDDWNEGGRTVPKWQWADTSDLNNVYPNPLPEDFYGAMYNDAALSDGRLAPTGWRLPTEADFRELEAFLTANGHAGREGAALKSVDGWLSAAHAGTDDVGFHGLPGGYVSGFGTPTGAAVIAAWATTDVDLTTMTRVTLNLFDSDLIQYADNRVELGAPVRCLRDD